MLFYVLISLSLFLASWALRARAKVPASVSAIPFVILFLFVAFRYQIGCDWFGYELHYEMRQGMGFLDIPRIEPLYWTLVSLLDLCGLPYQSLQVLVSAIFFISLYRFSSRFSNPILVLAFAFPLFIFGLPMSALRQALAASFIMPAFVCMVEKKWFSAIALIAVASQFHVSSFAFIVFPILMAASYSPLSVVFALLVLAAAYTNSSFGEAYQVLSERYALEVNQASGSLFRSSVLSLFGLVARLRVLPFLRAGMSSGLEAFVGLSSVFMISFPLLSILSSTVSDRYSYYFAVLLGPIAILAYRSAKARGGDYLLLLLIVVILSFFVLWFFLSYQLQLCYVPYRSVLTFLGD